MALRKQSAVNDGFFADDVAQDYDETSPVQKGTKSRSPADGLSEPLQFCIACGSDTLERDRCPHDEVVNVPNPSRSMQELVFRLQRAVNELRQAERALRSAVSAESLRSNATIEDRSVPAVVEPVKNIVHHVVCPQCAAVSNTGVFKRSTRNAQRH